MQTVRQAVFLVGGKGTRLGALTRETPKPLLPLIDDFCLLDLLIEEAERHGFTDIVLLAGYRGELIEKRYHEQNIRGALIRVIREPQPLGTAGCLKLAKPILDPWFLLANGDSFFDINLRTLTAVSSWDFDARIALREVTDVSRYGSVEHQNGIISAFREKSESVAGRGDINAGIYLLSRRIADMVDRPTSLETEIYPALVEKKRLRACKFDGYFIDMGLPDTYEQAIREVPPRRIRSCAFLDRDGVLNVDKGYTHKVSDLRWIDGARELIRDFNDSGRYVIIISNQAGVARGFYTEEDVEAFHTEMNVQLAAIGAHIDAFYFCPYHADGTIEKYTHPNHPNRKPNPGMLHNALEEWPIDASTSFFIGDKESDIGAAKAAGIKGLLFEGGNLRNFFKDREKTLDRR